MYWPIGIPKEFVSHDAAWSGDIPQSNDAASEEKPEPQQNEHTSSEDAQNEPSRPESSSKERDHVQAKPDQQADGEDRSKGNDSAVSESIIGLKVARNGVIFATITLSALTVWQVKVWLHSEHSDNGI